MSKSGITQAIAKNPRATQVRWMVAVFCALGLAINYIDRSAISVAMPFITDDIHLTKGQQGLVLSAFSWSYALMQIPAGRLIDRFGERLMFGASVLTWSVFTGLTSIGHSFGLLIGLRLGLGVGEAGAYPSSAKAVSRWFPARQRTRATSVYDSGARIGTAIATPVIAFIIGIWGWRAVFMIAGILGVLWTVGWWAWYRMPDEMKRVNQGELEEIRTGQSSQPRGDGSGKPMPLKEMFRYRTVWGMMLGFFCVNFVVTFFLTWFPTFLVNERGFDLKALGLLGMIPPLFSIIGSWVGGFLGDYLLAKGWGLTRVRKTCLIAGTIGCAFIAGAASVPETWQVLALMSLSYGSASFTIVSLWCLPGDVVDTASVASLGSAQNFLGNIGSALNPIVVGFVYGITGTFGLPLLITGVVAILGALCFGLVIKQVQPLRGGEASASSVSGAPQK